MGDRRTWRMMIAALVPAVALCAGLLSQQSAAWAAMEFRAGSPIATTAGPRVFRQGTFADESIDWGGNYVKGRPGNTAGHTDAVLHNRGATMDSQFTSWTHDRSVAQRYAGDDGVILEWQTGSPPANAGWRFEWSLDVYHESEVLIQGVLKGARVTRP